jgi:hypothetical protein
LLLRRAAVRCAGPFNPGVAYGEDWEYWIRLALLGRFVVVRGRNPVLFVRRRPGSAYDRGASDPAAFGPCMQAIFSNPDLQRRLGPLEFAAARRGAEAENAWIIGRALICHGRDGEGVTWLRRSLLMRPSGKRAALLAVAYLRYGCGVACSPTMSGLLYGLRIIGWLSRHASRK